MCGQIQLPNNFLFLFCVVCSEHTQFLLYIILLTKLKINIKTFKITPPILDSTCTSPRRLLKIWKASAVYKHLTDVSFTCIIYHKHLKHIYLTSDRKHSKHCKIYILQTSNRHLCNVCMLSGMILPPASRVIHTLSVTAAV